MSAAHGCGQIIARHVSRAKVVRATPLANALEDGIRIRDRQEPRIYILDRDGWLARPYADGGSAPETLGGLLWAQLDTFGTPRGGHDDVPDALADGYSELVAAPTRRQVDPARRGSLLV
jgi:hypothetical protein